MENLVMPTGHAQKLLPIQNPSVCLKHTSSSKIYKKFLEPEEEK
jgi:hypothetical protein